MAVINPPFAVNDEDVHLARIHELAEGRWLTRSDAQGEYHIVPSDYVELGNAYESVTRRRHGRLRVQKLWQQLTAPKPAERVRRVGRAGSYPPLLYIPHVPALWIAKQFDVSALVHLYAVRLAALLAYVWLAFRAVSASRELQWLFIVTALTPMALTQAASVSGDGLVIGLSMLCFALVGKGACTSAVLTRRELAELFLATAVLTLCKPVYVLVVLCWPALRWSGSRAAFWRWLFPVAGGLFAVGLYGGWLYVNRGLQSAPGSIYDPAKQLAWLGENPAQVFHVARKTFFRRVDEMLIESIFVRNKLSSGLRFAGGLAVAVHLQLLIASALGSAVSSFPGKSYHRRLAALGFLVSGLALVAVVPAAFYICCTRVSASELRVLQGRYFIPAIPAFLLALSLIGRPVLARWLRARGGTKTFVTLCITNLFCLACLIGWHYGRS